MPLKDTSINYGQTTNPKRSATIGEVEALIAESQANVEADLSLAIANTNEIAEQLVGATNELKIKKEVRINIKQPPFNATGTPGVDDWDAIQRAIDYAFSLGEFRFPILEFGTGTFEISKPLYHAQSGNYGSIVGAGIRQTHIKATAPMDCMLYTSAPTGVHSRKLISGITFDGNYLADCLLDGTYLRYSIIEKNEFIGVKAGGYCVKFANWVTRFQNNTINGQDSTGTNIPHGNGLLIPNRTINNFVIENNSFTSCVVGLKCDAMPNSLSITKNTFDNCSGTGAWFTSGARLINILDNYFEACGQNGVSVEVAASTFETWYGAIVAHGLYTATASTPFRELNIKINQFANCSTNSTMSLANLRSFDVGGNQVYETYSATYFVNLRWTGVLYTTAKKAIIDHTPYDNQFTQLVGFNTLDNRNYASGINIRENNEVENSIKTNGFELKNLINWTGTWTTSDDGVLDGIFPIKKLEATSVYKTFVINLAGTQGIKGNYFNCNVLSRGVTGATNGIKLQLWIDDVQIFDVGFHSDENWMNTLRNTTFYVPKTAVKVEFRVRPYVTTLPVWFTKFNISNASKPMSDKVFLKLDM